MNFFKYSLLTGVVLALLSSCAWYVHAEGRPLIGRIASRLWERQIEAYEREDAVHPPQVGQVLFVGSSSIRRWDLTASFPEQDFLNRGFGGSQVSDMIRFAERVIFAYQPRLIVFYSGENDLEFGKTAEQVHDDYETLCEMVHRRLPQTQMLILSVKFSPSRNDLTQEVTRLNQKLEAMCAGHDERIFVDVHSPMLNENGQPREDLFVRDRLHLSEAGYELWAAALRPVLLARL